jgi:purine-nucleoside phosphorylase
VKSQLNISGERKGHLLAVILSSGHEEFRASSNASSIVSYKDIPHFPVLSSSGVGGSISLASFPRAEVLIFHNHQIEGFGCEEGVFVAELLYELGVYQIFWYALLSSNLLPSHFSSLHFLLFSTFSGGQVSSDVDIDSVVYLSDIVDWTSNHPVPSRARRQISNLKPLTLHNLSLAKQLLPSIKEGSYIGYLGPSLPTLAEVNFAQKAGLSLAGITSLAHVYAAASLGIEVTAIANVTYSAFTQVEVSNKSNSSLVKVLSGLVEKVS